MHIGYTKFYYYKYYSKVTLYLLKCYLEKLHSAGLVRCEHSAKLYEIQT